MAQENLTPESPLEKAKRLTAEKWSKDKEKNEAAAQEELKLQERTQKLEELGNLKLGLEEQLSQINSAIEASRGEAHETRETMKTGGLDQDIEYKEAYDDTISEVASNLNELRHERQRIKAELEKINSDVENFNVNENIAEARKDIQAEINTVDQENSAAIEQITNYPNSGIEDIAAAQEVVSISSQEITKITKTSDEAVENIVTENASSESMIEKYEGPFEELESQYSNLKNKIKPKQARADELMEQWTKLALEENHASSLGETKKVAELRDKMAINAEMRNKINIGEKKFEQLKQHQEKRKELKAQLTTILEEIKTVEESKKHGKISNEQYQNQVEPLITKKDDLYDQINRNYNELDKIKKDEEFGKEEESLEYLRDQEAKLIDIAREKLGYNWSVAKKATEELGSLGYGDAHRLMLNNYLGIDLPVFSQDFETKKLDNKGFSGGTSEIILDNSTEGRRNREILAEKQKAVFSIYVKEAHELSMLPEDSKKKLTKLIKENNGLLTEALSTKFTGTDRTKDSAIHGAFMCHSNSDPHCQTIRVGQKFKLGDEMIDLNNLSEQTSLRIMFTLTAFKIAKDNGLIE